MNAKDFVVLPWGKPGNTVKLKYKNAQELKMEKIQLELDTQDMEKRLQEFHSAKRKEKEERKSSGFYWKSGQMGKLNNQSHAQNKGDVKLPTGKVKLKLLKEPLQEPVKRHLNYRMANSSESEKPKRKGKVCGQCENKAALLVCLECGEDYCSGCFAKIHQKGALKLHRTTLLQARSQILSTVLGAAHHFIKEVNLDEPRVNCSAEVLNGSRSKHKPRSLPLQKSKCEVDISTSEKTECTSPGANLLTEKSFDEDASLQSFQEALNHWRTGHQGHDKQQNLQATKPESVEECEVQTNLKIWSEPVNIEFKEDSLSYLDKIWLKMHRSIPEKQPGSTLQDMVLPTCLPSSEPIYPQNENSEVSEAGKDEVQHQLLLLPVEDLTAEKLEPALRIIELDDTNEEECEEIENGVSYKVDLAPKDSQQSCTIYGYQNTFLYGNDILHHHVSTKGKTDLLHLPLSNCSSYCKDNSKAEISNTSCENTLDSAIYSSTIENLGGSSFSEINSKEKNVNLESNLKLDDSNISLESNYFLPRMNNEQTSIKEKVPEDINASLEFSNLYEKANKEDFKATESPLGPGGGFSGLVHTLAFLRTHDHAPNPHKESLSSREAGLQLLQEIALRSKPITEQYRGLERFFVFDKTERVNSLPSPGSDRNCSSTGTRMRITGDRDWIPEHSVSAYASDMVVDWRVQQGTQDLPWRKQRKRGQASQRPSTANLPFPSEENSNCHFSPLPRLRSAAVPSSSGTMLEFPEIEFAGTNHYVEHFLDVTAEQQTWRSLGKGFNMLRNLSDPSENFYSPASEELVDINNHLLNLSLSSSDCPLFSQRWIPYEVEGMSSSAKDPGTHSLLTLSGDNTDEEDEDISWQETHHTLS